MKRYPKKPNHLLLTVSSKVNVRHINTEKTETAPHNNFMIRCCDTFLDRDKV